MSAPQLNYTTRVTREQFGTQCLEIATLEDLNRTIDDLFALLEREGKPELLESLCPYFGVVWPAARALTERLTESPELFRGDVRVLELGSGLAIPSLLCARMGASVTVTDFHPEVPRFLERNLALNGIDPKKVTYRSLDWKLAPAGTRAGLMGEDWDLILASDVLYEREHPELLAAVLHQLMGPQTVTWIADPARPYLQAFTDAARSRGLEFHIEARQALDTPKNKDVFLLRITRSPGSQRGMLS